MIMHFCFGNMYLFSLRTLLQSIVAFQSLTIICINALHSQALANESSSKVDPKPIIFTPSQHWEGRDGQWSTFVFHVGNPPQEVRLLPSTGSSTTYVVAEPVGCNLTSDPFCEARGEIFSSEDSTSWKPAGGYNLFFGQAYGMGIGANGAYGLDTLGPGFVDNETGALLSLDSQLIVGIVSKDYYLGFFGLNLQPFNLSDHNQPITSFIATLHNQGLIPSLTWSYTAGTHYRSSDDYGSLIFGGYDQAKFLPGSGLSLTLDTDVTRDIVVSIPQISTLINGYNETLLPPDTAVTNVFIDSTTPYLWLPLEVCKQWEFILGLQWDNTTQLYLVSDSLYQNLTAQTFDIVFQVAKTLDGASVDIKIPYAAFDLQMTNSKLFNGTKRYFPLKRAQKDESTLGRVFLQEAYLTVDYQRQNFSLQQRVLRDAISQDVVTIYPYVAPSLDNLPSHDRLSTGALLGIVLPIICVTLVFGLWLGAYCLHRSRNKKQPRLTMINPFQRARGISAAPQNIVVRGAASQISTSNESVGDGKDGGTLANAPAQTVTTHG